MTPFVQAQSYVGMPYRTGEFDCGDLARLVMQQVFGRQIALPAQRTRPGGARGQAREILRLRDTVAQQVDLAFDGCAVLLWEPDEEADGHQLWHLGTAFVHAGEVWVLHNSARLQGAALHRLADLRRWGMRLDGFYAWRDAA